MLDSPEFIRSIGGFVNPFGDFEPFPEGEQQITANSFASDSCNNKAKITELKYRPGMEGGFVYIPSSKFLALEAGGVKNSLRRLASLGLAAKPCPHLLLPS